LAIYAYNFREELELDKDACIELYETLINLAPLKEEQKGKLLDTVRKKSVKVEDLTREVCMQRSEKCPESNPTYYLNKIWNKKYEDQLITFFREDQDFVHISDKFR
jgi:hypothetical protein